MNIIGSSFGGGFLATKFAVKSKRKLRSLFLAVPTRAKRTLSHTTSQNHGRASSRVKHKWSHQGHGTLAR
ncbi:MAG: hypothetical protein WCC82_11230, partial [Nitrososphaeraceae archaeon]